MLTNIDYNSVQYLEDIVESIDPETGPFNNFISSVSISVDNLKNNTILDKTPDAEKWIAKECPKELHINHGQYVKDGMEHIIKELTLKPSSNRALYSLISQTEISDSGDKPIPSFLIFQTKVIGSDLYCSVYFRALEISTFLRINLEEIRIRLVEITDNLGVVSNVNLCIFAFYAYHDTETQTLNRPKLDTLSVSAITQKLNSNQLHELLVEKSHSSTVIELDSILKIKEIMQENPPLRLTQDRSIILQSIEDCLSKGAKLKDSREKHSHHPKLEEEQLAFSESIINLSTRMNNDD